MKLYKVVGVVVLLIAVSLILFVACEKNSLNTSTKSVIASYTPSSGSDGMDSSKHLSAKDIKIIMRKIDSRVKKVKDSLNYNYGKDHYDKGILVFRNFNEQKSPAQYYLYYDEHGKLIYAEIAHYRGALYSIYFHNDELLHVKVGPFSYSKGAPFINGDMANVKAVIKKHPSFAFVLEDISLCLEHAYKPSATPNPQNT